MVKLGKFEIKEQLGQGGMGVVYRAWDSRMERWVALKTIAQDKAARAEFIKRFRREALSAGRLDHPNIVTIYEFDEQEDVCYIAMQFLEGSDLESLLASPDWEKEFNVFRKLDILIQVCQGLAYAHRNEVVHRDVKPANIMVLPDGAVKLVDFGIARIGEATSGSQNTMLGTAPYMAPEQVEGKLVDERVDVFAVGVVGFRMFTRHFPFEASNLSGILYKIVHDPPPPLSTYLSDFPPDLERVLSTALAKDRDQRYRTMEELGFEFQRLLSSLNTSLVSSYMEEAKRLVLLRDFAKAKDLLRKVLELEPGNATATALWQQVQKLLQQEYTKRNVQTLLNEGIQAYERSDWMRALDCFDQGLQLDPAHEMLQTYRNLTLREKEKIQKISQNLKGAREARQRGDLTGSRLHLVQVLDLSPENTDAQGLLAEVDAELAEIEKRRSAQQYVDRAQQALSAKQYGDALSLLDKAQALDPANRHANRLRSLALTEQAEAEQQKVRAEKIAAVQAALENGEYATAAQQAEVGLRAFPGDPALQQLQQRATQGLETARRKKQLAEQVALAKTLLDQGDLAGARKIHAAIRERDPQDARVLALAEVIVKLAERLEREQLRDTELERVRGLMRENRYDEARRVLNEARDRFGRSGPLLELQRVLAQETKRIQQESEVQTILRQSSELCEADALDKAAALLRKAARKYQHSAITDEQNRVAKLTREAGQGRQFLERVAALIEKEQWAEAQNALLEAPEVYRRLPRYKQLWLAAAGGGRAIAPGPQDEIPTGFIAKAMAVAPGSAGTAAAVAPARAQTAPLPRGAMWLRAREKAQRLLAACRVLARQFRSALDHLPAAIRPPRFWYLLLVVCVMAAGIAVVAARHSARKAGAPAPAAVNAGTVRLEVVPWAELREVRRLSTGELMKITGQTPMEFSLPPGDYRLLLGHPRLGDFAVPLRVKAGAVQQVRHSFPKFDPEQVLKDYE
jgi:serine/threonine-protein kinase